MILLLIMVLRLWDSPNRSAIKTREGGHWEILSGLSTDCTSLFLSALKDLVLDSMGLTPRHRKIAMKSVGS